MPLTFNFKISTQKMQSFMNRRISQLTNFFAGAKYVVFDDWINGRSNGYANGDLITNPAYIIESILRDYLDYDNEDIEYSTFDAAGNTTDGILKDWIFAGFIAEQKPARDIINNILSQCKSRLYKNGEGKWELSVYQDSASATVDYKFDKDNNVANIEIKRTSFNDIIGTVRVNYAKRAGNDKFQKQTFIEISSKFSGARLTADVTSTDYSWDVDDTSGISSGDYLAADDEIVKVASVTSSTNLSVNRAEYGSTAVAHLNGTKLYKLTIDSYNYSDGGSSSYESSAVHSLYKYHTTKELSIDADFIHDDVTAEALRDHLFQYYSRPHYVIEFDTFLNAADLKIADIIEFDDSVMDAWLKLGGESWAGKKFEVMDISRSGLIDFHVKAVEL